MKEDGQSNLPLESRGIRGKDNSKFSSGTNLTEEELKKAKAEASTQEREIYFFLHKNKQEKYTKTEIWRELVRAGKISERTPESSISRALSNLRDRNVIVKLRERKLGGFNVRISLWKILETIPVGAQTSLFK